MHTLQIHGTADGVIAYAGGCLGGGCFPGAVQTTETWANYDGCSLVGQPDPTPIDIDGVIPGNETNIVRYDTACLPGGSTELWTITGGVHSPNLSADYNNLVIEWCLATRSRARPVPPTSTAAATSASATSCNCSPVGARASRRTGHHHCSGRGWVVQNSLNPAGTTDDTHG